MLEDKSQKAYWVALTRIPFLGAVHLRKLIESFETPENIWHARREEVLSLGFTPRVTKFFLEHRRLINPQEELEKVLSLDIQIVTFLDEEYPPLLKEIYDPPIVLYLKGEINCLKNPLFSIVGTRKITAYGRRTVDYFVKELADRGFTIVSGLAKGVDFLAHQKALESGGKTIAILGSGLDIVYPPEHKALASEIIKNGALVSEFPLGTEPLKKHFPIRNRIISGLSAGLLIIEAAEKSGALITANQALEQNREIFAVPGSIFNPLSKGTFKLIKMGAKPVEKIDDILEEFNLEKESNLVLRQEMSMSKEEKEVLEVLRGQDSLGIDEMKRKTGLPIFLVSSLVTKMEMNGKVVHLGGSRYAIKKS